MKMNAKKLRAAELLALGTATQAEIAAAVGVSDRTLRNWANEQAFQVVLAEHLGKMRRELAPKVLQRMRRILEAGDDATALQVINLVMRQAGWFDGGATHKPTAPPVSGIVYYNPIEQMLDK